MSKPGDRVGAVLGMENGVMDVFGYGEYVGDISIKTPPLLWYHVRYIGR